MRVPERAARVGTAPISLCPHHPVTFSLFVPGQKLPNVIYLASQALASNLLIRFEALWKSMPRVLIALSLVTKRGALSVARGQKSSYLFLD